MGHFKRGRAKNRRSGCLLCKPWKANGAKASVRDTHQEIVAKISEREQVTDLQPHQTYRASRS